MTRDASGAADATLLRAQFEQAVESGEHAYSLVEGLLPTLLRAQELDKYNFVLSAIMMIVARRKIKFLRKALEAFQGQLDQLGLKHGASLGDSRVVLDPRAGFMLGLRVDGAIIRARATSIRVRSALDKLHAALEYEQAGG